MSRARVELRPFGAGGDADYERLLRWIPDAELLLQWGGRGFSHPLDRAQLEAHRAGAAAPGSGQRLYTAVRMDAGAVRADADPSAGASGADGFEVVGHGELSEVDDHHRSAVLSRILVGPTALRGRGLGEAIVRALCAVAFEELDLHRVSLRVFDFNEGAIRCYERAGFRREGLLRDARRLGETDEYWSLVVMGLLRSEWSPAFP